MKFSILAASLFVSVPALASTQITCGDGVHSVVVDVDVIKTNPPQSSFVLMKNGRVIGKGTTTKIGAGSQGPFGAWLWTFRGGEMILGVLSNSADLPKPGKHAGSANVMVTLPDAGWDSTGADCVIEIK